MVRTQGSNRAESIPLVGKMAGDVEAYSEAGAAGAVQEHVGDDEAKRFRTRVAGFAAGVVFALCVLGAVAANQGGGVTGGVAAALGGTRRGGGGDAGWLVPRADTSSESKRDMPAYLGDTLQGRKIVNKEGGLPVGSSHSHHAPLTCNATSNPWPLLCQKIASFRATRSEFGHPPSGLRITRVSTGLLCKDIFVNL